MSTFRTRGRGHRPMAVPATEAAKSFGRLVDRVREEHATIVIERGGKPVAQITPLEGARFTFDALKALVAALPRADAEYLTTIERNAKPRHRVKVRTNPWKR